MRLLDCKVLPRLLFRSPGLKSSLKTEPQPSKAKPVQENELPKSGMAMGAWEAQKRTA